VQILEKGSQEKNLETSVVARRINDKLWKRNTIKSQSFLETLKN